MVRAQVCDLSADPTIMGKFQSARDRHRLIHAHPVVRNVVVACMLFSSHLKGGWSQASSPTSMANEKEQIYMDLGFVIYPPKQPRLQDPEVQNEVKASLALREEQQRRMSAEAKAQQHLRDKEKAEADFNAKLAQHLVDKEKAEADFNARLTQERQHRLKVQTELQGLIEQKNRLIQSHVSQLKSEEGKRQELMAQLKKQASEETETESRLSSRLLAEEQARLELQSIVRQLESERSRLQQELDKLKTERRSTILISPSGK